MVSRHKNTRDRIVPDKIHDNSARELIEAERQLIDAAMFAYRSGALLPPTLDYACVTVESAELRVKDIPEIPDHVIGIHEGQRWNDGFEREIECAGEFLRSRLSAEASTF